MTVGGLMNLVLPAESWRPYPYYVRRGAETKIPKLICLPLAMISPFEERGNK